MGKEVAKVGLYLLVLKSERHKVIRETTLKKAGISFVVSDILVGNIFMGYCHTGQAVSLPMQTQRGIIPLTTGKAGKGGIA